MRFTTGPPSAKSADETPPAEERGVFGYVGDAAAYGTGVVGGGGRSAGEAVSSEAIEGCWKVDENGHIVGNLIKIPRYDPSRIRR